MVRVVELFAGVGGFRLGLERAGHTIVWANEWDKYAAKTYDKNFGGSIDRRDITTIPAEDIPEHDIICGGFPCQAFSIAGKRRGFDETRGTLFFEIARIAAYHKTKYLLLENVRGLLNHDGGHTFTTIIRTLDELGYDCQWQVLNSKDFGVPQNRERVIIVANLRAEPRPQIFPIIPDDQIGDEQGREVAATLTVRTLEPYGSSQDQKINPIDGLSQTLSAGHFNQPKIFDDGRVRRLTPVECERLQGFPDHWTAGVSDTQRYKQMGNAVTVNVIEAVAMRLPK